MSVKARMHCDTCSATTDRAAVERGDSRFLFGPSAPRGCLVLPECLYPVPEYSQHSVPLRGGGQ